MKESNRKLPVLYLVVPCYNEEDIILESSFKQARGWTHMAALIITMRGMSI